MIKEYIKNTLLGIGKLLYGNHESKVIYYHDIHSDKAYTEMSTSMKLFQEHITVIQEEGYTVVPEITQGEKQLLITFDDGFRGVYENFSYFEEHQIPIKIFLIIECLGKPGYLSIDEVKELLNTGLVTIGSHTCTHRDLDELTKEERKIELEDSKERLEKLFGVYIDEICYPRGKFNKDVIKESKEIGYILQYSCLPGSYYDYFSEDVIRRNLVQHAKKQEFSLHLKGAGEIFYRRYLKQQFEGIDEN